MRDITARIDRVRDYLDAERTRRAAAEELALRQLTDAELEHLLAFLRANTSHERIVELGKVAQMARPAWVDPPEWAAALRYEQLYFSFYRQRGGRDEDI